MQTKNEKDPDINEIRRKSVIKRLFLPKSSVFIDGREKIELSGCRSIMAYSEDLMVLRLSDTVVRIYGERLEIRNFYGGRIIITGRISSLGYSD